MNWIILVLAGLFEIGWAIGLKYTDGFSKLWPTVWTLASMIVSLGLIVAGIIGLKLATVAPAAKVASGG